MKAISTTRVKGSIAARSVAHKGTTGRAPLTANAARETVDIPAEGTPRE